MTERGEETKKRGGKSSVVTGIEEEEEQRVVMLFRAVSMPREKNSQAKGPSRCFGRSQLDR